MSVDAMGPWLDSYLRQDNAATLYFGFVFEVLHSLLFELVAVFFLITTRENFRALHDTLQKEVALGPILSPPFSNLRVSSLVWFPRRNWKNSD